MVQNTKIEWAHHTFNAVLGCQKVGPGCDNCYAEGWAKRSNLVQWGAGEVRRVTSDAYWKQPLKWDAEAAKAGERHRVFCSSLADVFDNAWPEGVRERLFQLIRITPHLDWMLLTKRAGNIAKMLPADWGDGWPNVWLGITVVNQEEADRDVPKLLSVPAHIRFLSMEPLLGPVDLTPHLYEKRIGADFAAEAGGGSLQWTVPSVDLVIVGGESGAKARPMHPDWVRGLRDQCVPSGTSFHFKQWGENAWAERIEGDPSTLTPYRAGKKSAGRELDGRTWDEMPEVRHG